MYVVAEHVPEVGFTAQLLPFHVYPELHVYLHAADPTPSYAQLTPDDVGAVPLLL